MEFTAPPKRAVEAGRLERVDVFPGSGNREMGPRYSVRILDCDPGAATKAACFIVPQGREHEYVFASDDGLRQIAASAKCARLIVVALESRRGHVFSSLEAVQGELSAAVVAFAPPGTTGQIAFMTVGSLGNRSVVARGPTASGDEFFIEEVDEADGGRTRRLVFGSNPNVVQTEVRLVAAAKKGKKKGGAPAAMAVDHGALQSAYHVAMLATAAFIDLDAKTAPRALAIGLGGGVFVMALRAFLPKLKIDVCELDAQVVTAAEAYFGFQHEGNGDASTSVSVGDGLDYFKDASTTASPYSFIAVDVDAKDETSGMCCPPPAFVARAFLRQVRQGLTENGVCVVNVVARDATAFQEACANMAQVFGSVATLKPDEDDVNCILVGRKSPLPASKKDRAKLRLDLRNAVGKWLVDSDAVEDPLELLETLKRLEFV
ncbi:S-adenosyl-L-methionine-dependent methyltransferase [Pelagophyceae sp. CCMP2097]|nr:S-adenosyl-L-methionine-dependent methyltransferase [Pelagophyceae sp. CCMP2097]